MVQVFLEAISGRVKEGKEVIWNSLFTKGNSCLTNLIAFCDETTGSVDDGRAIVVICLDFSNTFHTASLYPSWDLRSYDLDVC